MFRGGPYRVTAFVGVLLRAPARACPRWNWIHHQSVTIVVDNDWVNAIFDDHGGMVPAECTVALWS